MLPRKVLLERPAVLLVTFDDDPQGAGRSTVEGSDDGRATPLRSCRQRHHGPYSDRQDRGFEWRRRPGRKVPGRLNVSAHTATPSANQPPGRFGVDRRRIVTVVDDVDLAQLASRRIAGDPLGNPPDLGRWETRKAHPGSPQLQRLQPACVCGIPATTRARNSALVGSGEPPLPTLVVMAQEPIREGHDGRPRVRNAVIPSLALWRNLGRQV